MRLFSLYSTLVRPILEVNAVIFHSMLTMVQSDALERLQKQVVGLCFGFDISYRRALEENMIDTLKDRRTKAMRRFTAKAMTNLMFANRWFVHRQDNNTEPVCGEESQARALQAKPATNDAKDCQ